MGRFLSYRLAFVVLGLGGCAYNELTPAGAKVIATASRPSPQCKSLGIITGKGGGGGGGLVSNEQLVQYAINDLRNQGAAMGATHVETHGPSFGSTGDSNTTTSTTVVGEALQCSEGQAAVAPTSGGDAPAAVGCQNDNQCKGERVCVSNQCVDPAPAVPVAPPAPAPVPAQAAPSTQPS